MSLDNLTEYIIPIGLLLLYFFVSSGKKGKKSAPQERVQRPAVRREREPVELKTWKPPRSGLEERVAESTVAARQLNAEVKADLSDQIVSQEMQKYSKSDLDVIPPPPKRRSRARALFKQKEGLRHALLIKEILTRPFE